MFPLMMAVTVTTLVHLILALPVITLCSPDQYMLHQIYVDNKTGVDDPSCWEGGYSTPCFSFNLALTGAQYYKHSTTIFVQPGQHQLHYESKLKNMSQLAIVGNGSQGEVVIRCEPLAGLAFFWSEEINMTNVSLVNCGAIQNSSSEYNSSPLTIQVAILFTSCKEIQLTRVHVIESNGTGVVIYNSMGVVYIDKCTFSSNELSCEQETMYGGGGLIIECDQVSSRSVYTIMNSNFSHNTASSGHFSYWPAINPGEYFGFGRGGGISVVFRGGAANNTVQLSSVYLDSNRAQFGGGLYLAFLGNTSSNTVSIDGAEVTGNEALLETGSLLTPTSSGGGVFIGFEGDSSRLPFDNLITVSSSNFTSNTAETGGGMTVDVLSNSNGCTTAGNKLVIEKCVFDDNEAFQGASAYMSQSSKSSQTLLDTTVCCSNFTNGHCGAIMKGNLLCIGNIVLDAFHFIISSHIIFADNNVSAISLYFSTIELLPSTQLQFINNKDDLGAALYLADCSSLVVNSGIVMLFENNAADYRGASIYAGRCKLGQIGDRSCFIQHRNSTLHPDDWNVNITFVSKNVAIYIDSAWSCIWPNPNSTDDHRMFCWTGWHFVDKFDFANSCDNYLKSGPFSIIHKHSENYSLYPGECISPNQDFIVRDYWGHDITDETSLVVNVLVGNAQVINNDKCKCPFIYEGRLEHVRCNDQHVLLLPNFNSKDYSKDTSQIMVHPPKLPGITVYVNFLSCEYGAVINIYQGCICEPQIYTKVCTKTSHSTCTICFDQNSTTCASYSNGWAMCGSCNDTGYGVAINSPYYICTECPWYGGAIFVLIELVPVLIMMIILAVLHINITNGNLNGFILYSQLVTVQFPRLGYSSWIYPVWPILLAVYSNWNLNFLSLYPEHFCIPHIDTVVGVIGIQYIIALCPLLFIVVTYIWIRWYNNGYRFVVWITRPVHQLLARFWQRFKIQPSLIDTYAGLLLLSFMCFLATSVKLSYFSIIDLNSTLNTNRSIDVTEQVVLSVTAVLCLLVFAAPLMIILLFYHLKIFQQCLTWCKLDRPGLHALVDAYQGCFKNIATDGKERRYFAGFYLLFRFCYLAFVLLPFTLLTPMSYNDILVARLALQVSEACLSLLMAGLVVILQPYKKTAHNVIDFLLLFFMAVISAASLASYYIGSLIVVRVNFELFLPPLPVIVVSIYLIYCLLTCCCKKRRQLDIVARQDPPDGVDNPHIVPEHRPLLNPTTTEVVLNDNYVPDDLYPDRIINPGGYREQHCQYQPLEDSVLLEN